MLRQLYFLFVPVIFIASCNLKGNKDGDLSKTLAGNWLILYPQHELANGSQRKVYAGMQDSIVGLLGLKTLTMHANGSFAQSDSILSSPGQWHYSPQSNHLFIRNAGRGFDFFKARLLGIANDTLRIVEMINAGSGQIKLVWHLKRIDEKDRKSLFAKDANRWRKNDRMQDQAHLKRKVNAILEYYSLYYKMIAKESAYFIRSRVFLPFSYYQHSMVLKAFDIDSPFSRLFHSASEAKNAYIILSAAMDKISDQPFPSGKNFVIEYAMYLQQLASAI